MKENAEAFEKIAAAIIARGGNVDQTMLRRQTETAEKQLAISQRAGVAPLPAAQGGVNKRGAAPP